MPSLSQRTPRESPTLATVNSLSDSRATRHVVPERERGEKGTGRVGKMGDGAARGQGTDEYEIPKPTVIRTSV